MSRRNGEAATRRAPASTVPPIARSGPRRAVAHGSRPTMASSAPPSSSAEISINCGTPMRCDQQRREGGPGQGPAGASGGDDAVQALGLVGGEDVGHEAPEHRHHEQVEDADPDEEGRHGDGHAAIEAEHRVEDEQAGDEEAVDDGQEDPSLEPRHQRPVQWLGEQHAQERAAEQPLQLVHAEADAHLLAQWPQQAIGAEQREEVEEAPGEGGPLVAGHAGQQGEAGPGRARRGSGRHRRRPA